MESFFSTLKGNMDAPKRQIIEMFYKYEIHLIYIIQISQN